jgi:hypothetical protein
MKEYFVSYELALKLKEKGFREHVKGHYKSKCHLSVCSEPMNCNGVDNGEISAPQIHEAITWLRKEKHLHIEAISASYGYLYIISRTPDKGGADLHCSEHEGPNDGGAWDDVKDCYVAAIEYCLNELI